MPLAIFCSCTAWFVSDLVRIHIVGFLMSQLIWLKIYLDISEFTCFFDNYYAVIFSAHMS